MARKGIATIYQADRNWIYYLTLGTENKMLLFFNVKEQSVPSFLEIEE